MNVKVYGFETGVLIDKTDEEFNHYACNNKELNYGFYNENNGFVLEQNYEKELKSIREYVENGIEGSYGLLCSQGEIELGSEDFHWMIEEQDIGCMNWDFFKDLNKVEFSICKQDGKVIEGFLEDALKKWKEEKEEKLK